MTATRTLPCAKRVALASQDAVELAIDALHDPELQDALIRRNDERASKTSLSEMIAAAKQTQTMTFAEEEEFLISVMHETHDNQIRGEAAIALGRMMRFGGSLHSLKAGPEIINELRDGKSKGSRNSLIYALHHLHQKVDLLLLAKLMTDDADIDTQWEIFLLIESNLYTYTRKIDVHRSIEAIRRAIEHRPINWHRGDDYFTEALQTLQPITLRH